MKEQNKNFKRRYKRKSRAKAFRNAQPSGGAASPAPVAGQIALLPDPARRGTITSASDGACLSSGPVAPLPPDAPDPAQPATGGDAPSALPALFDTLTEDCSSSASLDAPAQAGAGQEPGPRVAPPAALRLFERRENGIVIVTEAGLTFIERMAAEGHSATRISKLMRLTRETFKNMRKRDPRIDDAIAQGLAANESELVNLLMEQAREGQIVPMIFLLKGRHGWTEGQAREGGAARNVIINLPGALSPEQYMKTIEVKADGE